MMASNKVRRIDFYHDEYIAGVGGTMSAENQGVYWMVCALIFSHGGEVENDPKRIGRLVCLGASKTRRIIAELVSTQKLSENGTKLTQKRAENELEKAQKRIENASENGQKGGRPPKENNGLPEATGLNGGKLTTNHQPPTTNPKEDEEQGKKDTGTDVPDAFASVGDYKDRIWGGCLKWLVDHTGKAEANLRPLIGKWCRDYGEEGVCVALEGARRDNPADPISWITAKLAAMSRVKGGNTTPPQHTGFASQVAKGMKGGRNE